MKKICSSDCCLFSVGNVRSLVPSLLEDTGKLLNECVPSSLISFSTSPLLVSGGDEARAKFWFWKQQQLIVQLNLASLLGGLATPFIKYFAKIYQQMM